MKKLLKGITAIGLAAGLIFSAVLPVSAASIETGARGAQVTYVQKALKELSLYDYDEITGFYGPVTEAGVAAFQKANGLEASGIVDDATMNALKAQVPPTEAGVLNLDGKTVGALNWYSDAQYIFAKETTALVTDVETGKSWYMMRTFGHHHADVEPLTQEDADIIKEVWGGKWSWTRRAVVVEVGDYVLAASMVAVPHAGRDDKPALAVVSNLSGGYGTGQNLDAVKGNGIDGVMCIHFQGSKIHGTNVVDKQHQNAVSKAAEYLDSLK